MAERSSRNNLAVNDLSLDGFLTAHEDELSLTIPSRVSPTRGGLNYSRERVEENANESENEEKEEAFERMAKFTIGSSEPEVERMRENLADFNLREGIKTKQSDESGEAISDQIERVSRRQRAWRQGSSMLSQTSTIQGDDEADESNNRFEGSVYGPLAGFCGGPPSEAGFVTAGKPAPAINKAFEEAESMEGYANRLSCGPADNSGTCCTSSSFNTNNNNSSNEYGSCGEAFENFSSPREAVFSGVTKEKSILEGGGGIKIWIEDCATSGTAGRQASDERTLPIEQRRSLLTIGCDDKNSETSTTFHNKQQLNSSSAFDVRHLEEAYNNNLADNYDRLGLGADQLAKGSLSDNTHERGKVKNNFNQQKSFRRPPMQDLLKNWRDSNNIVSKEASQFNLQMDCLERLSKVAGVDLSEVEPFEDEIEPKLTPSGPGQAQQVVNSQLALEQSLIQKPNKNNVNKQQQEQRLKTYAAHLTHLYKRNQAMMDNNADFRSLLYNIICCLLIQDNQVLSTISVTKMIDVIRTHLESTSRFYSSAMHSITSVTCESEESATSGAQQTILLNDPSEKNACNSQIERRKTSLGSLSCTSSNSSSLNATSTANQSSNLFIGEQQIDSEENQQQRRNQKPADFRRISSVSYNDEQLINDLCCDPARNLPEYSTSATSGGSGSRRSVAIESPWKFEELSSECKHHNGYYHHQTTSYESSLDISNHHNQQSNMLDLMNDSGIGTIYDSNACDQSSETQQKQKQRGSYKKRHSTELAGKMGEFKPKQKPPYMSTDDYLSQVQNETRSIYDEDEDSCILSCHRSSSAREEAKPIDVGSRRAELEWTLNKLINFELKYAWLTSRDTLRRAIRKIGVPNEIRGKVWMILIEQMIGTKYDAAKLLEEASKTISEEEEMSLVLDDETGAILKQIELDVNRTMPGHKLFDDGGEGGVKLRRILVAYSIHVNRAIAYCQGFNFIVALLLSVFEGDEERALRGFVCIVDHIFPSKFYFDHYLTGARADQFLLADFICDQLIKNPTTVERKMVEGVTSSITLNWFISLFHGAVPTLTRLTILDHFMLEGVKALFRFTMAILYLAFQVTPPSSCEVFTTIRNTAKDMYDIKLLLSIVEQIKLPKDSYFAIRRSFYMVQSSFNSDQFYMQSLSNDASRQLVSNKPLNCQQLPDTKQPAMSLITAASIVAHQSFGTGGSANKESDFQQTFNSNQNAFSNGGSFGPRVCVSSNRSKLCIQNIGKMGRSHIKIMDVNVKSNERSLMSPLRNCLVIGISNCGKIVVLARQSSRKNFKIFREQDIIFHLHEVSTEIFDGFCLEELNLAIVITHLGEIFKIDTSKCFVDCQIGSTESLFLRDSQSLNEFEKVKLKLASMDRTTNLLWIYVECEEVSQTPLPVVQALRSPRTKLRTNNPFLFDKEDLINLNEQPLRANYQRKIIIVDMITFDIFSAFTVHANFGSLTSFRTSLVAFCQVANPMSNQFSSRIVRVGPTGRYEHLLSFSDVVDFMIKVPEQTTTTKKKSPNSNNNSDAETSGQRYSTLRRLLTRSMSMVGLPEEGGAPEVELKANSQEQQGSKLSSLSPTNLTKYYRSLMRSQTIDETSQKVTNSSGFSREMLSREIPLEQEEEEDDSNRNRKVTNNNKQPTVAGMSREHSSLPKALTEQPSRAIITSYLGDLVEDLVETNYIPVNMAFIFRNGKIALFEFTESYAIHTRESQLDRYDYSKIIEVSKNGDDFIITILTVYDKLIKKKNRKLSL